MTMMEYRAEEIAEGELQAQLNVIASEGWTLVSCMIHGIKTNNGAPVFVTIWSK